MEAEETSESLKVESMSEVGDSVVAGDAKKQKVEEREEEIELYKGATNIFPKLLLIVFLVIFLILVGLIAAFLLFIRPAREAEEQNGEITTQEEVQEEIVEEVTVELPVDLDAMRDSLREIEDSVVDIDATFELITNSLEESDEPPAL